MVFETAVAAVALGITTIQFQIIDDLVLRIATNGSTASCDEKSRKNEWDGAKHFRMLSLVDKVAGSLERM